MNEALAQTSSSTVADCSMCQWMMGWSGGSVWGSFMMLSMLAFWVLLLTIMVLLVVWLVKQIKK